MKLIVGLGNPDIKYKNTRHNVGFMVIEAYAKKNNMEFRVQKEFKGETALGRGFVLLKPLTYMNLSGESVQLVSHYYHILPKDILVISDDFNLKEDALRLREKGSAGGHNGLKSIIACLGSEEFPRLRIGLGDPGDNSINFVLGKIKGEDRAKFETLFPTTSKIIQGFIDNVSISELQNYFNSDESVS